MLLGKSVFTLSHMGVCVCVSMNVLFFCCRFLYIEIWLSPGATFIESQLFYSV